jgi:hypothetical protein
LSMHLEGPWLSSTGKKKGKQKFRNAEQARKAREQADSWNELLKRHGVAQEDKKRARAMAAEPYKAPAAYRRETPHIASLNSKDSCGVATKAPEKVYTGKNIVGIATMHKSNAVPVFSAEDAIDISKMRR